MPAFVPTFPMAVSTMASLATAIASMPTTSAIATAVLIASTAAMLGMPMARVAVVLRLFGFGGMAWLRGVGRR